MPKAIRCRSQAEQGVALAVEGAIIPLQLMKTDWEWEL